MKNITCDIIEDLLPLYHDNVCSNDSKIIVEEHLKNCPVEQAKGNSKKYTEFE